jgi:hypothetical protein
MTFSSFHLAWRKFSGCNREFGFVESLRRSFKEITKSVSRKNEQLDISWITNRVAIGAAPRSEQVVESLKQTGITDVIDLRAERDQMRDALGRTNGLRVYWVPTLDDWMPKSQAFFCHLFGQTKAILNDNKNKLLLCCGAGEHRAPIGGLAALILLGYLMDDAISEIQKKRPVSEFLPPYVYSLKNYQERY